MRQTLCVSKEINVLKSWEVCSFPGIFIADYAVVSCQTYNPQTKKIQELKLMMYGHIISSFQPNELHQKIQTKALGCQKKKSNEGIKLKIGCNKVQSEREVFNITRDNNKTKVAYDI